MVTSTMHGVATHYRPRGTKLIHNVSFLSLFLLYAFGHIPNQEEDIECPQNVINLQENHNTISTTLGKIVRGFGDEM